MMIEVTSNRLNLIPYISGLLEYNYIIYSIFEGSVPGKIYVDELPKPNVILVWDGTSDSGIYIEGRYTPQIAEEINRIILQEIFDQSKNYEDCLDFTCCWAPHSEWEKYLDDEIFKSILIQHNKRSFYAFNRQQEIGVKWRDLLPNQLTLILYEKNTQNSSGLRLFNPNNELSNETFDIQKFDGFSKLNETLQYSKDPFACVIVDLKNQKLVTRVFSDWNSEKYLEIGIFTDPKYRKQGLGSIAVAAMIEIALERGYDHIGWHCWIENEASAKTALRAGFKFDRTHPVRHAWYNQFDNLFIHDDYLIENQRFEESVLIFNDLLEHIENQTQAYETSYFRKQTYYSRWLQFLQIINYANATNESGAINALNNRIKEDFDDPQAFLDELHSKIVIKSIWQNKEWQKLIENLLDKNRIIQ